MGEFGEVGRDRRGTLLRVDLRFEQRLQLLTFDTSNLPPTQHACGKWRFWVLIPYCKCKNAGGDCFWVGVDPTDTTQPPKTNIFPLKVMDVMVIGR